MLGNLIELVLPVIIAVCEAIGIFVVVVSVGQAFYKYMKSFFTRKETNFKFELELGLASALEFKMAAEILKTVLVRSLDELFMLGAVILLRALMAFLIHIEMKVEPSRQELLRKKRTQLAEKPAVEKPREEEAS